MKRNLLVLLLFFNSTHLLAQKRGQARIDSLIAVLPSVSQDSSKVKILIDISNSYSNNNPAEGLRYAELAIALTEKKSDTTGMIGAYNIAGVNYKVKGDYSKAIDYHSKALALAEILKDKKGMAAAYGNMGSNYLYQGLYPKSLEYYLKALKLAEEMGIKSGIASNIGNIGSVYSYLKEYDKSIDYYERAVKMYEEMNNKNGIAVYIGNAGYVYVYKGDFEKALRYINRSMKLNEELGNTGAMAGNAQGIGRIYQTQHNYVKAIENYEKALALSEKVGSKLTISQNLLTAGEVYLMVVKDSVVSPFPGELATRKGLLAKALDNANRAIALRKALNDLNGLNFAYDTKSEIELASGDAVSALASYQEHIRYRDSVFNLEKTKEINRRELQYEFGKREDSIKYQQALTNEQLARQELLGKQQQQQLVVNKQQLLLISKEKDLQRLTYLQEQARLQREKEVQASLFEKNKLQAKISKEASDKQIAQQQLQISFDKKVKIYLGIAVASVILIAFLVFYNQQQTKKLNRIIGKQKEELEELGHVKDRIFSVVSHDMRTPVNSLISFIDILEDEAIPAEKLQVYAAELKNQLSHTSILMENLLNWASSQMKGFTPRIETIAVKNLIDETSAVLQQQAAHKNISIINRTGENITVSADKNMLGLVIRNTLSNAVKFTPQNGSISIDAVKDHGQVAITVTDSGTGMPPAKVASFNDPEYLHSIDTKRGTHGETGTGLGLMLCKIFAGLMNGSMHVKSTEGTGSVFAVMLPGEVG
jgi:signal transduction histidine kinase